MCRGFCGCMSSNHVCQSFVVYMLFVNLLIRVSRSVLSLPSLSLFPSQNRFSSKMAIKSLWKLISMVSAICRGEETTGGVKGRLLKSFISVLCSNSFLRTASLLRLSCSRRRAISLCWSSAFCAAEDDGGGA